MTANIRHSMGSPQWGTPGQVITIGHRVLKPLALGTPPIDVDPFSEAEFNAHVGALRILTGAKGLDGFKDRWIDSDAFPRADHLLAGLHTAHAEHSSTDTALVNPPGDEKGENVKRAWWLASTLWERGWLDSVLWVAFNLNQLQTLQEAANVHPLSPCFEGLRCVPDHRLAFTAHSTHTRTVCQYKVPCSPEPRDGSKLCKKHKAQPQLAGSWVEAPADGEAPSHPCFFVLMPSHNDSTADAQRHLFAQLAGELGAVF